MPAGLLSTDTTTLLTQFLTILRAGSTQGFLADVQSGALGNTAAIQSLTVRSGTGTSLAADPGRVGAPAITIGELTSGFYWISANNLGASINGTLVFDWNASRIKSAQPVQLPDGTVTVPALTFSAETTTGFRRAVSGALDFVSATYSTTLSAVRFSGGTGVIFGNGAGIAFTGSGGAGGTTDTSIYRGSAAMQWVYGNGAVAGSATSLTTFLKATTAIADNTATAVMTITIPNAAHSASWLVTLAGSLGAGGAIGANEATGTSCYAVGIARTAGVNAVGTVSTIFGSGNASVAGAATITVTAALSTVSGAVGATNTFTLNATIARGSGASTNHTCQVSAILLNANATGVTLS